MPRPCSICTHDQASQIDSDLLDGVPYPDIARRYAVSKDAVARHRDHLPAHLAMAQQIEQIAHADDLLERLQHLTIETLAILQEARDSKLLDVALRAIGRAEKQIELQAKLLGELQAQPEINLHVSPEWVELRSVIIHALEPHPAANGPAWNRVRVPATDVPRITPEFLEEERAALGTWWFEQEYGCTFVEAIDNVFTSEDVLAALSDQVRPLFEGSLLFGLGLPTSELQLAPSLIALCLDSTPD